MASVSALVTSAKPRSQSVSKPTNSGFGLILSLEGLVSLNVIASLANLLQSRHVVDLAVAVPLRPL